LFSLSYLGIAISPFPDRQHHDLAGGVLAGHPDIPGVGTLFLLPVILVYTGWFIGCSGQGADTGFISYARTYLSPHGRGSGHRPDLAAQGWNIASTTTARKTPTARQAVPSRSGDLKCDLSSKPTAKLVAPSGAGSADRTDQFRFLFENDDWQAPRARPGTVYRDQSARAVAAVAAVRYNCRDAKATSSTSSISGACPRRTPSHSVAAGFTG
jgi:hypothetical protein